MRLTAWQKLKILKKVLQEGEQVSSVCSEAGIARKTFYQWKKKYQQTPNRIKNQALKLNYASGKHHPKNKRHKFEDKVISIVVLHPSWGSRKISAILCKNRQKISNHAVYSLLKDLNLETKEKREEFSSLYQTFARIEKIYQPKPLRLTPESRKRVIEEVVIGGESVSDVCRKYRLARKTFYKWLARYQEAKEKEAVLLQAMEDNYVEGFTHPRSISEKVQEEILRLVRQNPEYSTHKIAQILAEVGNHGVQNVFTRLDLNTYEKRLAYVETYRPAIIPAAGVLDRVKPILGKIPVISAIPPPKAKAFRRAGPPFIFSFLSSIVFSTIFIYWLRMLSQVPTLGAKLGLFFASISLLVGSFFFAYSMKYYLTLAIVLSFSRQAGEEGIGIGLTGEVKRNGNGGWLARIFGLNGGNGGVSGIGGNGREIAAGGLQPSLEHIKLKRYPFVSIHLPFYNERKVAERILKACTAMDYPNFEIVVIDDSTDETTKIVERFAKKHNQANPYGPKIKVLHRPSRKGFKGGALGYALKHVNPKTEFVVVFDADFIPYLDTLELFIKYFKANNQGSEDYQKNNVAVVGGYQWHVLNKSENWITRGVRTEYAGSYVIERPGREIIGLIKQISGSVYMIRADVLKKVGWGTSITEDFQLTLKLYEQGYKVIYTPYIQAPAECASTLKRLIRQRMRWAEGHSNNIKKMFFRLMSSPKLTLKEKLEVLYLSPYYLQAFFFLVGTFSWLLAETVFRARLPFWTSLWGWSLVLTNFFSLPLVNTVGLFLEESEERDYLGLFSFVALSYIMVPFQAYASVKGFIQKEEGPWFRTPKTGKITDIFTRGKFYRWISGILPGKQPVPAIARSVPSSYLALVTANNQFNQFKIPRRRIRWLGRVVLVILLVFSMNIVYFAPLIPLEPGPAQAPSGSIIKGNLKDSPRQRSFLNLIASPIYAFEELSQEILEKRTQSSKTYDLGDGEYAWEGTIGPIHYKDDPSDSDEFWKDIDTTIKQASTEDYEFKNETNTFKSYFKKTSKEENLVKYQSGKSFLTYTLRDNELGELNEVGGYPQNNQFVYLEAYDEIDIRFSIYSTRLLEEFVLKQYQSIERISQEIYFEGAYFEKQEDGSIVFYDQETDQELWTIPRPVMYEEGNRGEESLDIHYEITPLRHNTYLITKVLDEEGKAWLADEARVYPLVIDITVDKQVDLGGDDGGVNEGNFYNGTGTPWIGFGSIGSGDMFARWTGVTISGTITTSYIEIYAHADGSGTPLLKVYGVDEDDPDAPTTAGEFSADLPTDEAVDWDGAWTIDTWEQSDSLNSIFQELVDTYTISNEAVMVQVKDDGGSKFNMNNVRHWDYTGNEHGPKLYIEYTPIYTWDGSSSTDWFTGANWDQESPPGDTDDVVIDGNYSSAPTINAADTIGSLKIGENNTSVLTFSNNITLTVGGDVTVYASGTITHTANTTAETHKLTISAANIDIQSSGKIEVNGKGYGSSEGTGTGIDHTGGNQSGSGAGYGGTGGRSNTQASVGAAYGSLTQPTNIGSGGGNGYACSGGAGGGAIKINVTGTLDVDGSITADGNDGGMHATGGAAGGGSGGSIWLIAGTIDGTGGSITADGGVGPSNSPWGEHGGGGAGGRIAIEYTTDNSSLSALTAYGGSGYQYGGAGTVYQESAAQSNGDLTVDNGGNSGATTPMLASFTFDDITLNNDAYLWNKSGYSLDTTTYTFTDVIVLNDGTLSFDISTISNYYLINNGTLTIPSLNLTIGSSGTLEIRNTSMTLNYLTIQSGGNLTHTTNTTAETYEIDLTINNDMAINSGGEINLTSKGHSASYGDGDGTDGVVWEGAGGGGYGGDGGYGTAETKVGGGAYGSLTQPANIGSGGGNGGGNSVGGRGGGAIEIDVTGTLDVDGSIVTNGTNGTTDGNGYAGGGGSGGSVYITTATLDGAATGSITTNGGAGGNTQTDGGGGAGGRIAIHYTTDTYSGSFTAQGGWGYQYGGAGTVYQKSTAQSNGDLTADNGGNSGATTPMLASFTFDDITLNNDAYLWNKSGYSLDTTTYTFTDSTVLNDGTLSFDISTISNYYLINNGTLTIPSLNLTIGSSGTLEIKNTSMTLNYLTIQSGGTLTHTTNSTTETYKINLTINNDMDVQSSGAVNVNGKGYTSSEGLGAGIDHTGGNEAGSGAGYGGNGGRSSSHNDFGGTYGSESEPADLGSGGGNTYDNKKGGKGGGTIKINVSGTLTIDGSITANGTNGEMHATGGAAGGGSGGSIWLIADIITGSGTGSIAANGGIGPNNNYGEHGGGGAGGRIAYYYTTDNFSSSGTVTADGGSGYQYGEEGTIIPENLWLFLVLAPFLPRILRRRLNLAKS